MSEFKAGDKVLRIGPSFGSVEKGKIYTVSKVFPSGNIALTDNANDGGYRSLMFTSVELQDELVAVEILKALGYEMRKLKPAVGAVFCSDVGFYW